MHKTLLFSLSLVSLLILPGDARGAGKQKPAPAGRSGEVPIAKATAANKAAANKAATNKAAANKAAANKAAANKAAANKAATRKAAAEKAAAKKAAAPRNQKKSQRSKQQATRGSGKRAAGRQRQNPTPGTLPATSVGAGAPAEQARAGAAPGDAQPLVPRITGRVIHGSIYGQLGAGEKVAVVDVSRVFEVISAYQKIQREHLKKTKAQYHILIAQANSEFLSAVEAEALHGGIGLVVETGGVRGVPVVDITESVRKRLNK